MLQNSILGGRRLRHSLYSEWRNIASSLFCIGLVAACGGTHKNAVAASPGRGHPVWTFKILKEVWGGVGGFGVGRGAG